MSNPSNANKWKSYIDKFELQFQEDINFIELNKVIYKGLKDQVNNNWSVKGVNNVPKTIGETIKKSDTFIDSKISIKASDSQGLAFIQQGEKSSDKGVKGRGGSVRGQG